MPLPIWKYLHSGDVAIFDKFFDCMNVRSRDLWIRKLKPDLKPYTSVDDPRFKVGDTYTGCVTIIS